VSLAILMWIVATILNGLLFAAYLVKGGRRLWFAVLAGGVAWLFGMLPLAIIAALASDFLGGSVWVSLTPLIVVGIAFSMLWLLRPPRLGPTKTTRATEGG
jgi:hypothetical protein